MKIEDIRTWRVTATLAGQVIWQETRSGQGADRHILIEAKERAVIVGDITQAQADASLWEVS